MRARNIILLLTLLFGVVFEYIPSGRVITPFVFADYQIDVRFHLYYIIDSLNYCMLAFLLWYGGRIMDKVTFVYMLICIGDFIDYFLTFNTEWFSIGPIGVSYNVASFIVLAFTIYKYDE